MPFLWLKCGEVASSFIVRSDDKFKVKGDGSVCQVFSLDASTVKINGTAVPSGADGWSEVTVTELGFLNASEQTPLLVTGASSARGGEGQGSGAGTTGPAGTEPITITIYDPHETPHTTTATFKNAQKFEKFLDRGNITFLYKDGCSPGINDYCDLVPGATYTTAVRSIPARVKNLEQHKEHLVRRREHEFTCAVLDDLASKGVHAVELPEERVVKAGGADEAEVDVVISYMVPGCVGAVGFVGGSGREGAAHCVRRGFVIGSTKTHVSGDSDARNLGKKIQRQYAQRPPFAGHPIQPAFIPENVKSGQRTRLEDTCREKGIWLYARNGRSISRVQLRAAASGRLPFV